MTDEHCGAIHECERSVRELDVFLKCAQRVLYRRDGQAARLQKGDHVGPAGSISVGAVHQHHIFGRWYWPGRGWGATRGSRTHHRGDTPQGNGGYESPSVHVAFIPQYGRESQAGEIPVAGGDGGLPFLNTKPLLHSFRIRIAACPTDGIRHILSRSSTNRSPTWAGNCCRGWAAMTASPRRGTRRRRGPISPPRR